eukprot:GEMP01099914.1.p2 GENE.GEMP01099914.1~~GEMP01099914.1.p2  ORF type:complete len:104 (-),score=8.02 GEMP01099914.1:73-384(-)
MDCDIYVYIYEILPKNSNEYYKRGHTQHKMNASKKSTERSEVDAHVSLLLSLPFLSLSFLLSTLSIFSPPFSRPPSPLCVPPVTFLSTGVRQIADIRLHTFCF